MAPQMSTLVSPDGKREWTPADAVEATNLRTRGWSEKPAEYDNGGTLPSGLAVLTNSTGKPEAVKPIATK